MAAWLLDNFGTDTGLHSSGADAAVVSRVMELALPKIEYQEITQTACSLQQRIQKLTGQKNSTRSLQWLLQTLQQQHTDIFNRNHLYGQLQVLYTETASPLFLTAVTYEHCRLQIFTMQKLRRRLKIMPVTSVKK